MEASISELRPSSSSPDTSIEVRPRFPGGRPISLSLLDQDVTRDDKTSSFNRPVRTYSSFLATVDDYHCRPRFASVPSIGRFSPEMQVGQALIGLVHHGSFEYRSERGCCVVNPIDGVLYNPDEPFQVRHRDGQGDDLTLIGLDRRMVHEIAHAIDPRTEDHPERPFAGLSFCIDSSHDMLRHALTMALRHGRGSPSVEVDEIIVWLVEQAIRGSYREALPRVRHSERASRVHREIVHETKCFLMANYGRALTLDEVARQVETSPYHLCRVFKAEVGDTMHQFLNRLRLRISLGQVAEADRPLAQLASELGFSHHSHFTSVFRNEFGTTPSDFRRWANSANIEEMRARVPLTG